MIAMRNSWDPNLFKIANYYLNLAQGAENWDTQ